MRLNKMLSAFMAIILLLSNFTFSTAIQAAEPTIIPVGNVTVSAKTDTKGLIRFKPAPSATDFDFDYIAYTKDGKEWPAYCIQPNLPGATGDWSYEVNASTLIENPQVYGAIVSGHPFKTPAELGVKDTFEAYYITKLAAWSIVHENYSDPTQFEANGSENEHVYQAYLKLLNKAKNTAHISDATLTIERTDYVETSEYQTHTYVIKLEDNNFSGNYDVKMLGEIPQGTKIEKSGNTFNVIIPLSSIQPNTEGSFELQIVTASGSGNALVYQGVPTQQADERQSYALAYESELTGSAVVNYRRDSVPNEENPGEGQLRIVKLAAGTTTPLAGAEIKLTKADGGVYDIQYTNAKGEVFFNNLSPGVYYVDEVTPPHGYLLDVNSHKEVVILADAKQQTVTFENEETPKLRIQKVDAETGRSISGVIFEVSLDGGTEKYTAVTDSSGTATLGTANLLKPGTYRVKEVSVPDPYLIDPTAAEQYVKLEPGKTASAAFKNKKKSTWTIKKYIEGTDISLHGAEFSVYKKGSPGELVWSGIVSGGSFTFDGTVEPGWYTFEELSAPRGYLIVDKTKDVYIDANKHVEVKFDNRPRPELEIIKTDDAGNPLAKALFQIKKADGATVFEKWTDENGRILIPFDDKEIQLEEAVYSVKEIKAPEGFVLDQDCHKDVMLEWGQHKTLTFTNTKKPSLTIIKVDEETKEPLKGAKFKIIRTEDDAVTEALTDENGRIILSNLEPGIYSIDEISAPSGYLLEPQHKEIELKPGDDKELVFMNKARPRLRIQKVDANTGELLKNAEFRVTKVEEETVSEYILENGEIVLENLDEAIYRAYEFQAPDGYIAVQDTKEIMTQWGKTVTLKFDNVRKPVIMFKKTNPLTGKGVAGAKFKVEYETSDGSIKNLGSYTTNAEGRIIIPKGDPGWYLFTEIMPAPGYSMPSNPVIRQYFSAGDNAYLPEFEQYYTAGTGKYASGYAPDDSTTTNPGNDDKIDDSSNNPVNSGDSNDATSSEHSVVEAHSGSEYYTEGEGFNWPTNAIILKKADANTSELLSGAAFELYRADEQVSGQPGTQIGRYVTDASGVVVIVGLDPGYYAAKEVQAPPNYILAETSLQNGFLKADGTSIVEMTFRNYPFGGLLVTKVDALTGKPLANTRFKVTDSQGAVAGNTNGEYVTDANGEFLVENLHPGAYVISELEAPPNYVRDTTPQTVQIGTDGKVYKVSFSNQPAGSLVIKKLHAVSKESLAGAQFKVTTAKGDAVGTGNGLFTTDETGTISIPNLEKGSYIVQEIKAPDGFILENQTQTIEIEHGKTHMLEFFNKPKSSLQIIKIDSETKEPLKDAKFTVYKMNGEVIGEYVTDGDGLIIIDNLESIWYKIVETKAPDGYLIDDTPKDIEITHNQFVKVVFENERLAALQIKKTDEITGEPLAGAVFKVTKQNGEIIGEDYVTDKNGFIQIPALDPDFYVVAETKAPAGYILDATPKTVEVRTNIPTSVTFSNAPMAGLKIVKLNSETRRPIEGVEFTVTKMNGEKVENGFRGTTFKTDRTGQIYIPNLENGYYTVVETRSVDGYILDGEPKTVLVESGKSTVLEVFNDPASGLMIVKTDAQTGEPLEGVVFDVRRADGSYVAGALLDENQPGTYANSPSKTTGYNGDIAGNYTTDKNGRILINDLDAGRYMVTESKQLDGYKLDKKVYDVTIVPGKLAKLEIENEPLSSILIRKIDSVTKEGIYGVKFLLYDEGDNPIGQFVSDDQGYVWLDRELPAGKYKLRELEPAEGYLRDDIPRTIYLGEGQTTNVVWENVPQKGQIIITKRSSDFNEVTSLPAGSLLSGASFEIYNTTGNVVDKIISDERGIAASKLLPMGVYVIKEVSPPRYYGLSDRELLAEIRHNGDIVRFEVLNPSIKLNLTLRKKGPNGAAPGQTIRYDLYEIANNSSVSLENFYVHDRIPTDATRAKTLVTGTFSERMYYKVTYKTNQRDYRILAENLLTKNSYEFSLHPNVLGLAAGEYVTDVRLEFPKASPGFKSVENMVLFCEVMPTIPKDYNIVNRADSGGRVGNEWESTKASWNTLVWAQNVPAIPLPKTGY